MRSEKLLDAIGEVKDSFLQDADAEVRKKKYAWTKWAATAAAACICLVAGILLIPGRQSANITVPAGGGQEDSTQTARPIQPGGVPDIPGEDPPEPALNDPAPTILAWMDVDGSPAQSVDWGVAQGAAMVGEKLTAGQIKTCMPEVLLEWMANAEGVATYLLHDGSGGLVNVELKVTNPQWGGTTTIRIRDQEAWQVPVCGVGLNENGRAATLNGQEYCAYRHNYFYGEGDPNENPPQPWVELTVIFAKENLEYTMLANVPATEEDHAAIDLRDMLLAYSGTHYVPDLDSFQCGEYVHRDEMLSFSDARSDPDYGAYLPQEEPTAFDEAEVRRYQLGAVGEALTDDWLLAQWYRIDTGNTHLIWRVSPATEDAKQRLALPNEREKYDFSLYPATNWYYSVAPENRLAMENPTFRADDLTMELINARTHYDYDNTAILQFSVLFKSGVLVSIDARGVSPEWVFEQIRSIG